MKGRSECYLKIQKFSADFGLEIIFVNFSLN